MSPRHRFQASSTLTGVFAKGSLSAPCKKDIQLSCSLVYAAWCYLSRMPMMTRRAAVLSATCVCPDSEKGPPSYSCPTGSGADLAALREHHRIRHDVGHYLAEIIRRDLSLARNPGQESSKGPSTRKKPRRRLRGVETLFLQAPEAKQARVRELQAAASDSLQKSVNSSRSLLLSRPYFLPAELRTDSKPSHSSWYQGLTKLVALLKVFLPQLEDCTKQTEIDALLCRKVAVVALIFANHPNNLRRKVTARSLHDDPWQRQGSGLCFVGLGKEEVDLCNLLHELLETPNRTISPAL